MFRDFLQTLALYVHVLYENDYIRFSFRAISSKAAFVVNEDNRFHHHHVSRCSGPLCQFSWHELGMV